MNVSAHTPSTLTSILSSDGPKPENITQSTDFFEGDEVWFLMKDDGENVTMRVSIDIDRDGVFNQSNDVFSTWLNHSCELNENGTEKVDENCTVDFKYRLMLIIPQEPTTTKWKEGLVKTIRILGCILFLLG